MIYARVFDITAQLHKTLDCEFVNGSCIRHQRAKDVQRPGCPLADSISRRAGNPA